MQACLPLLMGSRHSHGWTELTDDRFLSNKISSELHKKKYRNAFLW